VALHQARLVANAETTGQIGLVDSREIQLLKQPGKRPALHLMFQRQREELFTLRWRLKESPRQYLFDFMKKASISSYANGDERLF
jgi:hypothetical protein